eukprot:TRINITY_DN61585_c0_g1_i1.p1 TRINITY_DN61585_c0_g1~~TRINITY_DN61585_c0_g1_i1.p1  ORF type:complete len:854 (+),score=67.85 TRINITY_DN61585_c0_g1_i1:36-2597(+)
MERSVPEQHRKPSVGHSHHTDKSARSSLSGSSGGQPSSSQSHSHSISTTRHGRRARAGESRRGQQILDRDKNQENQTKVLDPDTKEDRTPQSLLRAPPRPTPGAKGDKSKKNESGAVSPSVSQFSEERSFSRMESTESGSTTPKSVSLSLSEGEDMIEPLALDESLETSSMDSRQTSEQDGHQRGRRHARDREDRDEDGDRDASQTQSSEDRHTRREMTREERQAWMQSPCTITLTETSTFFVMERPDEQIGTEGEEAVAIVARNEVYKTSCEQREANKYIERGMQTFNNPMKNKETQFNQPPTVRTGVGVTTWEIHDTMRKLEEEETDSDAPELQPKAVEMDDEGGVDVDDETTAMLDGVVGGDDEGEGEGKGSTVPKSKRLAWMLANNLPHCLMIVERMVVQNVWQKEQLSYRNIDQTEFVERPPATASSDGGYDSVSGSPLASSRGLRDKSFRAEEMKEEDFDGPTSPREEGLMQVLWQYGCATTKEKNVSCLSWNKHNHDILAAGYGDYGITASTLNQQGFVCCWSIKNPVYPERTIRIDNAGVSAVDFSHVHPSLLAVGHTDGTLALFDIRKQSNTPALKSTVSGGQHTGTVWEVKWVEKGKDRGESLISISADGRVTDWSIKKGLECTNLIRLKRVPNKQQGITEVRGDALLSRQSGGMCVDFNASERMIYIVGTEDGTIHKCSTSYNEQYLQDYAGHAGPVYRCRWSPFCSEIFLTCSADWTAKMWNQSRVEPMLTFQSVPDAVHDVAWSPTVSTVFGAITATGRIDIWDLVDPLEPKTYLELDGRSLNCLAFANQASAVMVTGDNKGDVTVIKLKGEQFERPEGPEGQPEQQEEKLLKYLRKNTQ